MSAGTHVWGLHATGVATFQQASLAAGGQEALLCSVQQSDIKALLRGRIPQGSCCPGPKRNIGLHWSQPDPPPCTYRAFLSEAGV